MRPYQVLPLRVNGNEGVLRIPQRSSSTETSPSGWGGVYFTVELQSVYSAAPADRAPSDGVTVSVYIDY